jgi:hypothetical protein
VESELTRPLQISAETMLQTLAKARAARKDSKEPNDTAKFMSVTVAEYGVSKYVRGDNTPENAEYLGYIDARKLYPDFKPISFENFLRELADGQGSRPYPECKLTPDSLSK